jgi:hypothetical protein
LSSRVAFHASSRKEEDNKAIEPSKGGLFGTGLDKMYALPIAITAAVPLLKYELLVINEETQLAAVFCAFCAVFYTQGGDIVYKALDETAKAILKEHTESEDKMIGSLEKKLEFLKANSNMVNDFEAINNMREKTYANLNAAGNIKPQHDFKAQVEKIISMIAQEESNVAEKAKTALMEEATVAVTGQFESSKELKKAALESAIAKIKGTAKAGKDPVQAAFVKFFQDKSAEAAKGDDGTEAKLQRAALLHKLNSVAKNEGYFFQFDESGQPKMAA